MNTRVCHEDTCGARTSIAYQPLAKSKTATSAISCSETVKKNGVERSSPNPTERINLMCPYGSFLKGYEYQFSLCLERGEPENIFCIVCQSEDNEFFVCLINCDSIIPKLRFQHLVFNQTTNTREMIDKSEGYCGFKTQSPINYAQLCQQFIRANFVECHVADKTLELAAALAAFLTLCAVLLILAGILVVARLRRAETTAKEQTTQVPTKYLFFRCQRPVF
jgi:hypothetical protein